MKILGEQIFAKDAEGRLLSRIGTIFFKTPGLVTRRGVHAMQRMMWIDEVNARRAAEGLPAMTEAEEDAELLKIFERTYGPVKALQLFPVRRTEAA